MKALVDGDILVYRTAFASDKESEAIAKSRLNSTVDRILKETNATEHQIYLSDSKINNFRYQYYPQYKANRTAPVPRHYNVLQQHIQEHHNALIASGQEADDALGIEQSNSVDTVICSIDKDLKMIPGKHYNFVKQEWDEIEEFEGLFNFYVQLLTGDVIDNIKGVTGIGAAKAPRRLQSCTDEMELFEVVQNLYNNDQRLLTNGILLWVRRKPNEIWQFPNGILPTTLIIQQNSQA